MVERTPTQETAAFGGSPTLKLRFPPERARMVAVSGRDAGRAYDLAVETLIGREADASIRLLSREISRKHARIAFEKESWVIEDLGSRNGTMVNSCPLAGGPRPLKFGDRLQFGSSHLFIFSPYNQIEDQILQSQRIEAVGRLAGGIAHDFSNLLTAVVGSVDYLQGLSKHGPVAPETLDECLAEIRSAYDRGNELISGLAGFSGGQTDGQAGPVDVSAVAREVIGLVRRALPGNITLKSTLDSGHVVSGYASQIHQVLMNLCLNARDAMPDGGSLTVSVDQVSLDTSEALAVPFASPGDYVVLSVQDTGMGMEADTVQRACEPFFTTKGPGQGTGLGLSIVFGLVRSHGGHLQLESTMGRGTCARAYLPAYAEGTQSTLPRIPQKRPTGSPGEVAPPPQPGSDKTVLIVDDDEGVRRSLARLMAGIGYKVLQADHGRQGVAIFAAHQDEIHLVLLDLVMPRLSGTDMFHVVKRLAPTVPVILISGHGPEEAIQQLIEAGAEGFLRKPFDARALQQVVVEATQRVEAREQPAGASQGGPPTSDDQFAQLTEPAHPAVASRSDEPD